MPATDPVVPQPFVWENSYLYRGQVGMPSYQMPWPHSYPTDHFTLFSPEDGPGIHQCIVDLIAHANKSIRINMYGFDDDDADAQLLAFAAKPNTYFQMNLDKSQAGGVHEKEILAKWQADAFGNSIAIGQSSKHAISHLKVMVIDGDFVVTGSTNWSLSGEEQQDNQFTVIRNPLVAAQYATKLDIDHTEMLRQMHAADIAAAKAGGN